MGRHGFTFALLIALAITVLWWQLAERRARMLEAELQAARSQVLALRDSLSAGSVKSGPDTGRPASLLRYGQLESLRKLGLGDPVRDLLADLERHPDLIPIKGTLGGTMIFVPEESAVLSPEWVLGYVEDGHIGGRALLEYRVAAGGRITWKLMAAKRD